MTRHEATAHLRLVFNACRNHTLEGVSEDERVSVLADVAPALLVLQQETIHAGTS